MGLKLRCSSEFLLSKCWLRLKKDRFPDLRLIAAVPYPAFPDTWEITWQDQYHALLEKADFVKVISPEYHPDVYDLRNRWMIDHSAMVIAVSNGQPGGTRNTLAYAREKNLVIRCLEG